MSKKEKHINQRQHKWSEIDQMNSKLEVSWDESKDDIWLQMTPQMGNSVIPRTMPLWERPAFRLAVAALLVLMVSIGSFVRFYSVSYQTISGQHLMADLPDGSTINLNAESSVEFHPYWWRVSREVDFQGEGYFEVEKGSTFSVVSLKGTTSVLGTSFNIYARDEAYRVACVSGKVKVVDARGEKEVVLNPEERVEWQEGNFLKNEITAADATAWINNQFVFTGTPIGEVFAEIERQYGIQISYEKSLDFDVSTNFPKEQAVSKVLNYVCRPFNLNFVEQGAGEYQIFKNE